MTTVVDGESLTAYNQFIQVQAHTEEVMGKVKPALLVTFVGGALLNANAQQAATAADPHMTADERAQVIKWMNDTEKEYLDRLEHVSEAQWNWRPAPFRWTVGEVAEHIMLTEARLFAAVERALDTPENPDWQAKT